MNKASYHRVGEVWGSGCTLALAVFLILGISALPAQAVTVIIDLAWGYGAGWTAGNAEDNLIDTYHLQEGSIVQVVMYNSGTASAPGSGAGNNFDPWGSYPGNINAVPEPSTGGVPPDDHNVFDPESVFEAGHVIAYTTEIGSDIAGGGGNWYHIYESFEILGNYDSLYVRVFGATDFPNGSVIASYWGISSVQTDTNSFYTWYVPPIDNVVASSTNYFEVIPEPGTMALVLLGGAGLAGAHRRRRKRARRG